MKVSLGGVGESAEIPPENSSVVFAGGPSRIFVYFMDVNRHAGRIEFTPAEFRRFSYLGTQLLVDNKVPDDPRG